MNMKKTFTIGGVHPDENKLTATKPICELGLPKQAVYPLSQHIGAPSVPCVAKGDLVNVGTKIADAGGFMSAVIHSGVSGKVAKVDTVVDASGYRKPAIYIDVVDDVWEPTIDRSEDLVAEMYEEVLRFLPKNGLMRYELSNYAKEGFESRHNLVYWNNEFYYGFGAGAHSYMDFTRIQNFGPITHYIKALQNKKYPRLNEIKCTEKEQMEEEIFLGLRKAEGVSKEKFFQKFGKQISAMFYKSIEEGKKRGLLMESSTHIFLTEKGCLLGNEVFEKFLFD